MALGTGLGAIAFLTRPASPEGIEAIVVGVPIAAGGLTAWLVRGWRFRQGRATLEAEPAGEH